MKECFFFFNFQPRMGIAAKVGGDGTNLFRSKDHKKCYLSLLKRGVMHPRSVDFNFLDSLKVNLREKFGLLQLERFFTEMTVAHPILLPIFIQICHL